MLSENLCIKFGTLKQPAEAVTRQFVAKHTSIPVPKVYCAFERKGYKYMLMERVQGHILRDDWLERSYEGGKEDAPDANRLVEWHNQLCGKPMFAHGDLSTMNIIARGDEVVGIIDWEATGWWPEYWEYTCAWHVNPYNEFWREEVDKFLELKVEELDMERIRRKFFGDI